MKSVAIHAGGCKAEGFIADGSLILLQAIRQTGKIPDAKEASKEQKNYQQHMEYTRRLTGATGLGSGILYRILRGLTLCKEKGGKDQDAFQKRSQQVVIIDDSHIIPH